MPYNVSFIGGLRPARAAAVVLAAALLLAGQARAEADRWDYEPEEQKPWDEIQATLPAPPQEANLKEFYVDPRASNRFYVDTTSISVGSDGVVRYTLVVISPSGARNVSFEGLRCATRERRFYAFGNSAGAWSKARSAAWKPVNDDGINRPQASLATDYFCPNGIAVRTADEARDALRRGGHPDVRPLRGP